MDWIKTSEQIPKLGEHVLGYNKNDAFMLCVRRNPRNKIELWYYNGQILRSHLVPEYWTAIEKPVKE